MKAQVIKHTLIFLVNNLVAKLVIGGYAWVNLGISSLVICGTALLIFAMHSHGITSRFRVPMSVLYAFIGLLLFIIAQFRLKKIMDNGLIWVIVAAYGLEWIVYVLLRIASRVVRDDS